MKLVWAFLQALIEKPPFPRRPLLLFACGFAAGLALARSVIGQRAWVLAAIFFCGALLVRLLRVRALPLLLIACALGLIRLQLAYPTLPQPQPQCVLTGRIADTPVQKGMEWELTLSRAAYDGRPIDGRVLLTLRDAHRGFFPEYGQWVEAAASLHLPAGARNEGGTDLRFYYLEDGIVCTAQAIGENTALLPGEMDLYGRLLRLRDDSTGMLTSLIGEENGALAAGMLHGDKRTASSDTLADFRDAGVAHLLAVSGLHVTLLVGFLLLLLRRLKPVMQLICVALFLLFFSAFTAFSSSTVRAGVMALCMLAGRALWRRNDPLTSLALAFVLITMVSPFSVFGVGFQLSFTAVLGILLLYPWLKERLHRLPEPAAGALGVSIAGQAATLPVTAATFNRLPLLAVLANVLVVPLAPLVILPAGLALFIAPFSTEIAGIVADISDVTLSLMRAVALACASAGTLSLSTMPLSACMAYFCGVLFLSQQCLLPWRVRRTLALTMALFYFVCWGLPQWSKPSSYIAVLDIPYGYAAHVHDGERDTLIADPSGMKARAVEAYIQSCGLRGYAMQETEREGVTLYMGDVPLIISSGRVEVNGEPYLTSENGQLTLSPARGGITVQAYARDGMYNVLLEESG